jgi:hypothetical protein
MNHPCSGLCGAVALLTLTPDAAFFLTAQAIAQPFVAVVKSPSEPPLHPPPIQ